MASKSRYLVAILPDGYVKTIGPTAVALTHYWRVIAVLESGKTEIFWGHVKSLAEARKKRTALAEAERMRGWKSHRFEIVELIERGWRDQPLPSINDGDGHGDGGDDDGGGGKRVVHRRR